MLENSDQTPPWPFWLQLTVGSAGGLVVMLLLAVLVALGIPITFTFWIGVFVVIWLAVFLCLKHDLRGVIIGFGATGFILYAAYLTFLHP